MCHNLGAANTNADPFTPSWEINGGYWQWGYMPEAIAGPSGPESWEANEGSSYSWNTLSGPDNAWLETSKTLHDPCPEGYQVPTQIHWNGMLNNNSITYTGTWGNGAANYNYGMKLGDNLLLPAAGNRNPVNGYLNDRGYSGQYWSSNGSQGFGNWFGFIENNISSGFAPFTSGFSIRCIEADPPLAGTIDSMKCSQASVSYAIPPVSGYQVSLTGVVPYAGQCL